MPKPPPATISTDAALAELTTLFPTANPQMLRAAIASSAAPVAPIYLHLVGSAYGEPIDHDQLHPRGLADPSGLVPRYLAEIDQLLREQGAEITPQARILMFLVKMLSLAEAEREPYQRIFGTLVEQVIPAVYFIGATLSVTEDKIDTDDFIILRQLQH